MCADFAGERLVVVDQFSYSFGISHIRNQVHAS